MVRFLSFRLGCALAIAMGLASQSVAETRTDLDLTDEEQVRKGEEIVRIWDQCDYGFDTMKADFRMYQVAPDGSEVERQMSLRLLELFDYDENGIKSTGDQSIVVFTHPRDIAGTAVLIHANLEKNDDTWAYLPTLQRVKRISSANQAGNFAGTEFAYEDIASQEYHKFTYKWLYQDNACGVGGDLTCDVVEQIPIYPDSGYSKQLSWYDGCRQMKIEYFDHKDEHVKTQLFSDYREYYGKHWRGHLNTMINHVTGRQTRLEIDEFIYRTPMDGRDFTPEALPFLVQ